MDLEDAEMRGIHTVCIAWRRFDRHRTRSSARRSAGLERDTASCKGWRWYVLLAFTVPLYLTLEDLRVEWAKSLARVERWEEEVLMLKVEMNRILRFMLDKAKWWQRTALAREHDTPIDVLAGVIAYARKQAYIREELGRKFAGEWAGVYAAHGEGVPTYWPQKFRNVPHIPRQVVRRYSRTIAYSRLHGAGRTGSS